MRILRICHNKIVRLLATAFCLSIIIHIQLIYGLYTWLLLNTYVDVHEVYRYEYKLWVFSLRSYLNLFFPFDFKNYFRHTQVIVHYIHNDRQLLLWSCHRLTFLMKKYLIITRFQNKIPIYICHRNAKT